MKKKLILFLAIAMSASYVSDVSARARTFGFKTGKVPGNVYEGEVILQMNDGTTHQGWNRTDMLPLMKYVEISSLPENKGKKERFNSSDISRLVFLPSEDPDAKDALLDTVYFVKIPAVEGAFIEPVPDEYFWFRVDYAGKCITLYSFYKEEKEVAEKGFKDIFSRNYYIQIGDGPLSLVSVEIIDGVGDVQSENIGNKAYASRAFEDYPEMVEFIKDKKTRWKGAPFILIKEFENLYSK